MNYTIPTFYDSMISKLITYGRNRNDAINRMKRALSEYIILGVKTTIPFHKAILRNPNFLSGDLNTHFIDLHKKGIDKEMENVIVEDTEIVNKLKSTFMPGKNSSHFRGCWIIPKRCYKSKNPQEINWR